MGARPGSPLVQWMVRKEPERVMKGSPGGPGAPAAERNQVLLGNIPNEDEKVTTHPAPTFSRASGDVGLHLRPVDEGLGPDAEVVGDAVRQVSELQPEGATPLHVHRHRLTDAWGGGGVETVGTGH